MITGSIDAFLAALIRLTVHGPAGRTDVEAQVDTGYNGFLSLPLQFLQGLGLSPVNQVQVRLADGTVVELAIYLVTVEWDGRLRTVETDATSGLCLVGMSLLEGHDLWMRVHPGGALTIQAIP